jgi:hypothetical protein
MEFNLPTSFWIVPMFREQQKYFGHTDRVIILAFGGFDYLDSI